MPDQQLRMTALLANKVSGPLKQMQRDLAAFGKTGKALPQNFLDFEKRIISTQKQFGLVSKGSFALRKEFQALGQGIGRVSPVVGNLTEEMIGLTAGTGTMIGALVAGGAALAGASAEAANFARSMRELKLQSRETGFSTMQLEQLRTAGQRWGITADQITSDTESFALSLVKLQSNAENFRGQLMRLFPDTRLWAKMTTDAGKSSAAAFLDLLDSVDQIEKAFPGAGGVQRARVFLQQFGVDARWAAVGGVKFREELAKIKIDPETWAAAAKGSKELNHTLDETSRLLGGLKLIFNADILPAVNSWVAGFNDVLKATIWIERHMHGMAQWGTEHGGIFGWLAEKMRGDAGPATHPKYRGDLQQHFTTEGIAKALGLPAHAEGTMRVPRTGFALIHKGEEITPAHRARTGDGLTDAGRDVLQMGGTGELMIQQRRIWELYWRGFNQVGADYLRSFGRGGGPRGAGAGAGNGGVPGFRLPGMGGASGATPGVGAPAISGPALGRMFGGMIGGLTGDRALPFAPPFSRLGGGAGMMRLPGGIQLPSGITMPGGGGGFMPPQLGGLGGRRFGGPRLGRAHRAASGGGGRVSMPDVPENVAGNAYVAAARARFKEELKDPHIRLMFAAMLATEGEKKPLAVAESAMNRGLYAGQTFRQELRSRFYGPYNKGQYPATMAALLRNPRRLARLNAATDAALAGSDTIHGFTDQGLPTDPNGRWIMAHQHMRIGGNIFGDWGGGPAGHAGAIRWREAFERRAAANAVTSADRAAINGATMHKVEGTGSLSVDVRAPRGTAVQAKGGGIFQNVAVRRNIQMTPSTPGPALPQSPYDIPD